jgi:hypothetical protein
MFRKHSDDIPELTLPKWPFILGDLLLVATALAIAILGNWQLTDWQVVACVLAVALGAALFVLPFIVEYLAREQENSSVSDQHNAILASHVKELEARTAVMADQITRLSKTQSDTPKATAPAFDAAALQVIEDRLDRQAKQLEAAEQNLEKMRAAAANPKPAPAKLAPAPEKQPAPAATPKEKPASKSKTEVRPRKPAESQLLKRAIHEKQDRATQAVDRIIESKISEDKKETPKVEPKEKKPEPLPKPKAEPVPEAKVEPAHSPAAEPKIETPKPAPEPEAVKSPARVASKPKALVLPKSAPAAKPILQPTPKPVAPEKASASASHESKPEEKSESKQDAEAKPEPEPKPASDTEAKSESGPKTAPKAKAKPESEAAPSLFGASEVPASPAKTRAKKNETACTVNSLIGIGNKPYLRGSGGGLNWDRGVVMEFEAIGKWRWNVPADLDAPIEVQVYRNDEDPDTSGKHTLKPGEPLAIDAKFQG